MNKRAFLLLIARCIGSFAGPAFADQAPIEVASPAARGGPFGPYATAGVGAIWPIGRAGKGSLGSFSEYFSPGFSTEAGLGQNLSHYDLSLPTYSTQAVWRAAKVYPVHSSVAIKVVKHAKTYPLFIPDNSPSLVMVMLGTALAIGMTSELIHHSAVGELSLA